MLQATQLIICNPKSKIYENFQTAILRNKQDMFTVILLSFLITYFANSIYSELPNSTQAEAYSEPYLRFKMQLFENKFFSHSLFTQKAPSQMFDSFLNMPLELLTIFAKDFILMFHWVLDTPLICLKKDKNCKKPVNESANPCS